MKDGRERLHEQLYKDAMITLLDGLLRRQADCGFVGYDICTVFRILVRELLSQMNSDPVHFRHYLE